MARDQESIKKAAFNITSTFEGGGYATYQNYDEGIISYGRFQFTLSSGGVFTLLENYLKTASGPTADGLRAYLPRVQAKDEALRKDTEFKRLLVEAADDPIMQQAQDELATVNFWNLVQGLSIQPRNIQTPLGQALVFDMAINHGPRHDMIGLAEQALGVAPKSRMPDNGIQEATLIAKLAEVRRDRLYKLADKHGWGGLRQRGDFWVNLVNQGDWDLNGDAEGMLEVKPGRKVQVRNP